MPPKATRGSPRQGIKSPKRRGRKMASPAKVPNATNKENPEGANVDKIRDILFGSQMRDYEKRFVRLEDTGTKALDTLGSFIRQEVDSLSTRLKSEKSERTEAFKEISREIKDGSKVIEKKLSQLEEQMSDGQGELRANLLEHTKAVSSEIDKLRRDTAAALNREVDVLRDEKTDRAALADLFTEFSLRLKNKFELPEE